jgi:hypothetical protein
MAISSHPNRPPDILHFRLSDLKSLLPALFQNLNDILIGYLIILGLKPGQKLSNDFR